MKKNIRVKVDEYLRECEKELTTFLGVTGGLSVILHEGVVTEPVMRDLVTQGFKVTWDIMISKDRSTPVSNARFAYMYLSRKYLNYKLTHLAIIFNRDHTSVMHAVKTTKERLSVSDPSVTQSLSPIINFLNTLK